MSTLNTGTPENLALGKLIIDHGALCDNWLQLKKASGKARTGAVVKANGYGLGMEEVVTSLSDVGCTVFFVATPDEGVRLRKINRNCEVFVFAGLNEQNCGAYGEANLIPVLNSIDEIETWAAFWQLRGNRKPCAVQIDTGINRPGLSAQDVMHLDENKTLRHSVTIISVFSHLACGDEPAHPMNHEQRELFIRLAKTFPGSELSLSNSAGVFMGADYHFDLTRPGISIYGGNCFGDHSQPMRPVVSAYGKILQTRKVQKGETVGYGASHKFERDSIIAFVGCGYGDGIQRSLSGSGVAMRKHSTIAGAQGFLGGKPVNLLGRISMDSAAFDVTDITPEILEKEKFIEFFGENILLDDAALAAGSVNYELLTSLGSRYMRQHINMAEAGANG